MSELDKALAALEEKRSQEEAERRNRRKLACDFLKEFYESDLAPSRRLKDYGVSSAFDGSRILLERTDAGIYADGLMIVAGEQGEIDVSGRSLGAVKTGEKETKKQELIAEIIAHFSL
jgi:hypothetical protein